MKNGGTTFCAVLGLVVLNACCLWAAEQAVDGAAPAGAQTQPAVVMQSVDLLVVDETTGQPLANVPVGFYSPNGRAMTNVGGHAIIPYTSSLTMTIRPEGYVPVTFPLYEMYASGEIPRAYVARMEPGTSIGGIVVDEAGAPVKGVTVTLMARRPGDGAGHPSAALSNWAAVTDEQGRWRCDSAPRQIAMLGTRLSHPDFAYDAGLTVQLPAMDQFRAMTAKLVIRRGVSISGRIVGTDFKPLAGAKVSMDVNYSTRGIVNPATCDADGRFTIAHRLPNRSAALVAMADGFAISVTALQVGSADQTIPEIRLMPAKSLRLRLVDPGGNPLPGTRVSAHRWGSGLEADLFDKETGDDGRIEWPEAPSGSITLDILKRDYFQFTALQVVATGDEQKITLQPAMKVTGTVLDAVTGKPIDKFKVIRGSILGQRTTITWLPDRYVAVVVHDGKFEYLETDIRDGYAVRIDADGYMPAESRTFGRAEPIQNLEFSLKPVAELTATLIETGGRPLDRAEVLLVTRGNQMMVIRNGLTLGLSDVLRVPTDELGGLRVKPQPQDFALMVVDPRGFAVIPSERLANSPIIAVPAWPRIEGIALDGGKPAAGTTIRGDSIVEMAVNSSMIYEDVTADEKGHYVFTHLPPGRALIGTVVQRGNGTTIGKPIHLDLEGGKTYRVNFGDAGRPVIGTVVQPQIPRPLSWLSAHYTVTATTDPQKYFPVKIEQDGRFQIDDVPPGSYEFRVALFASAPRGAPRGTLSASIAYPFTVPAVADAANDEPLNLGEIHLVKPPP